MPRAATDVMNAIMVSAVLEGLAALTRASKGVPNNLLRDIQAIHSNTTFDDLPKELQDSIAASVRSAFTQLLKEGYAVAPPQQGQSSRPIDRVPERDRRQPQGDRPLRRGARPPARGPRPGGNGPRGGKPGGGAPR